MTTTQPVTGWKREWFDIEDAAYLNTAIHCSDALRFPARGGCERKVLS